MNKLEMITDDYYRMLGLTNAAMRFDRSVFLDIRMMVIEADIEATIEECVQMSKESELMTIEDALLLFNLKWEGEE